MAGPTLDLNGSLAGTNATTSFVEGTPVLLDPSATLVDVGDHTISGLVAQIASPTSTELLYLDSTASALVSSSHLTVSYLNGTLSISGKASASVYQSILDHIYY